MVLDADNTDKPRPGICPGLLVVGMTLLAKPRLMAWLRDVAGVGVSGDWAWLLGALMQGGEDVEVGLGMRMLLEGVVVAGEVLDCELTAFLAWCCICCWMAEL